MARDGAGFELHLGLERVGEAFAEQALDGAECTGRALRELGGDSEIFTAFFAVLALAFFSSVMAPKLLQGAMLRLQKKNPEFGNETTVVLSEAGVDWCYNIGFLIPFY